MGRLSYIKPRVAYQNDRVAQQADAASLSSSAKRDKEAPYRKWYRTVRWSRLRMATFTRDGFTCQMCRKLEGNTSKLICDHKAAHRGSERLFWDSSNLWTLCPTCHSSVKQREEYQDLQRGIGCFDRLH